MGSCYLEVALCLLDCCLRYLKADGSAVDCFAGCCFANFPDSGRYLACVGLDRYFDCFGFVDLCRYFSCFDFAGFDFAGFGRLSASSDSCPGFQPCPLSALGRVSVRTSMRCLLYFSIVPLISDHCNTCNVALPFSLRWRLWESSLMPSHWYRPSYFQGPV